MEQEIEALLRGTQFKQILECYIKGLKDAYGLKRTEIDVLYYLSHSGPYNSAKNISSSLHRNKGHISQTTELLCQKGYLSASRDENDYRIVHYSITEAAIRITEEIDALICRLYAALFDGIAPEDLEVLERVAAQMAENINRILPDS